MTRLAIRLKLVAVLAALFLAIGGMPLAGYAQEDSGSSSAEQASEAAQPAAEEQTAAEEPASPPAAEASPSPAPTSPEPVFQAPVEEPAASPAPSESPAPSDEPASPEAPAGETPAAAPAATEETEEVEAAVEAADEPATINVSILAVNCATAPATVVPGVVPDGCTAASGLKFEATVDTVSLGTFTTNGSGLVQVGALDGEILTVTEDLSSVSDGYEAVSATSTVTVAAGAALTLVHVETDAEPIPPVVVGRVQLTQGRCPTSGETRTELTYIEPASLRAAADEGCQGVAGAEFQITINEADTLAAAAVEGIKRTDANGNWRGELPVGSYIVTHVASGQSLEIEVVADEVSTVVAIDYIKADPSTEGTLSIRRFACPGTADTTEVTVAAAEPTPREGCEAENGTFQLNDGEPFSGVDDDGAVTFTLPTGTYAFTDLTGGDGAGAEVTVAAGATTWVMVERLMSPGDLTVQFNACSTPVSASEDPNNASFWASACNNPVSGAQVQLISAGEVVSEATTDGGGYATFIDVVSGTYQLRGGNAETCAVFVGNQGALGGVQVSNGQFIQSQVFACTKMASGPGGPIGEVPGGDPIPGNPGGNIKLPVPGPGDQNPTVTQLPSTGTSNSVFAGQHIALWLALIGAAVMALFATVFAVRYGRDS